LPDYAVLRGEALEAQSLLEQSAAMRVPCAFEEEVA
jgi:hypothetical protein